MIESIPEKQYKMVRRISYYFVAALMFLAFIFFINGCDICSRGCPECHHLEDNEMVDCDCIPNKECLNEGEIRVPFCDCDCESGAGWYGQFCELCNTISCVNGTWNAGKCRCDCATGWEGDTCNHPTMPVGPGGQLSFTFVNNGADRDTVSTDSFNTVFFNTSLVSFNKVFGDSLDLTLSISDNNQPLAEGTYQLSNNPNGSYIQANIDTSGQGISFIVHSSASGSATIDSLSSTYVSGTFQTEAHNSTGSSILNLNNGAFWYKK